jgi:hypothetical protein
MIRFVPIQSSIFRAAALWVSSDYHSRAAPHHHRDGKKHLARLVRTGLKSNKSALCEQFHDRGGTAMNTDKPLRERDDQTRSAQGLRRDLRPCRAADARPCAGDDAALVVAAGRAGPGRGLPVPDRAFEAANPGIKVAFETTSDEGYAPQLAAAFSSGEVPDIVTHLPSFAVQTYYSNGLIEPFDDVIAAIGADDFYPGANDVFRTADGTVLRHRASATRPPT